MNAVITSSIGLLILSELINGAHIPQHEHWPISKSTNITDYMELWKNTAILTPKAFHNCPVRGLLWVFVVIAPKKFEARQIIRETWANRGDFNHHTFSEIFENLTIERLPEPLTRVEVTFLLGKIDDLEVQEKIIKESETFGDILQEDFYDSYHDLIIKSMHLVKSAALNKCVKKCTSRHFGFFSKKK